MKWLDRNLFYTWRKIIHIDGLRPNKQASGSYVTAMVKQDLFYIFPVPDR